MNRQPDVSVAGLAIAILTFRGYETTRASLASLQRLEQWPVQTLIVDNASGTGEGERLAAEFGQPVSALTRSMNDGLGGGYNAAIEWALGRSATHVLLLNNDVQVHDPKLLTYLVEASGPRHLAVGPIVQDPDRSVWSCGGWVDWRWGITGHLTTPRASHPYDVMWLDGPCMLVSTAAAQHVRGLSLDYFMYYEDADWGVRAERAGYPCRLQPKTSIVHLRSGRDLSPAFLRLVARNRMLFMRRNASLGQNLRWLPWLMARETLRVVHHSVVSPRIGPSMLRNLLASFGWNISDALRRKRWTIHADGPELMIHTDAGPADRR